MSGWRPRRWRRQARPLILDLYIMQYMCAPYVYFQHVCTVHFQFNIFLILVTP